MSTPIPPIEGLRPSIIPTYGTGYNLATMFGNPINPTPEQMRTALHDGIVTKQGTFGAILTRATGVQNSYIEFSIEEDARLWAIGSYYSDGGGPAGHTVSLLKKVNGVYQEIEVSDPTDKYDQWYVLFDVVEAGEYRLATKSGWYASFNEFYFEKLRVSKMLLKSGDYVYVTSGSTAIKQKKGENIAIAANVKAITATHGYNAASVINGYTSGYPSSVGWYCPPGTTSASLTIEFNGKQVVDTVDIVSYYVGGYEPIKEFELLGSDSGAFLGEEKNLGRSIHPNEHTTTYVTHEFKNNRAFKFYRIKVLSIHPGNGNNDLSIHDLQMSMNGHGAIGLTRLDGVSEGIFDDKGLKEIEIAPLGSMTFITKQKTIALTRQPSGINIE